MGKKVFEFEDVISYRKGANNKDEYLVIWKGYGKEDNTWEPRSSFKAPDEKTQKKMRSLKSNSERRNRSSKTNSNLGFHGGRRVPEWNKFKEGSAKRVKRDTNGLWSSSEFNIQKQEKKAKTTRSSDSNSETSSSKTRSSSSCSKTRSSSSKSRSSSTYASGKRRKIVSCISSTNSGSSRICGSNNGNAQRSNSNSTSRRSVTSNSKKSKSKPGNSNSDHIPISDNKTGKAKSSDTAADNINDISVATLKLAPAGELQAYIWQRHLGGFQIMLVDKLRYQHPQALIAYFLANLRFVGATNQNTNNGDNSYLNGENHNGKESANNSSSNEHTNCCNASNTVDDTCGNEENKGSKNTADSQPNDFGIAGGIELTLRNSSYKKTNDVQGYNDSLSNELIDNNDSMVNLLPPTAIMRSNHAANTDSYDSDISD